MNLSTHARRNKRGRHFPNLIRTVGALNKKRKKPKNIALFAKMLVKC